MVGITPQKLALTPSVASISPAVLTGCNTNGMKMAHSPITISRGFNAVCTNTVTLQSSSMTPAVEGIANGEQTTTLRHAAVEEISEKHICASTNARISCSAADIICGRPRLLLDMDDKPLAEFDTMTMEQVDFIITNGGET